MKLFYRISIFINIVFACYILVKGSELLTKDLIGAKAVRNAQRSKAIIKSSRRIWKNWMIRCLEKKLAAWMKTVFRRMA